LTLHHATEACWGSGGIAPHIHDLGTKWRWVVSFTIRKLYPQGKSPWYPLDRKLCGPQNQSGHSCQERKSQPLLGLKHLIIQSAAQRYTTELSQIHLSDCGNKIFHWCLLYYAEYVKHMGRKRSYFWSWDDFKVLTKP